MKAYVASVESDPDQGDVIIFANTSKEARKQPGISDLDPDSFIDLRILRYPQFDDCENLTDDQMMLKQWREGWWFHTFSFPNPDETTDEEFFKCLKKQLK